MGSRPDEGWLRVLIGEMSKQLDKLRREEDKPVAVIMSWLWFWVREVGG